MIHYIKKLIAEGEHQQQDFKFEITDYQKIAKSLVAFANTDGGRLLIGVKDNGVIAGVRSEEEYFMIEGAAKLYCKPEVRFETKEWNVDGKRVLEINIPRGDHRNPHYAKDKEGKWKVYIRKADQNLLANSVLLKVWKRQASERGTFIRYTDAERTLLSYLEANKSITLSKFKRIAQIRVFQAENILVNFIVLGVIEMEICETTSIYWLREDYKEILDNNDLQS